MNNSYNDLLHKYTYSNDCTNMYKVNTFSFLYETVLYSPARTVNVRQNSQYMYNTDLK